MSNKLTFHLLQETHITRSLLLGREVNTVWNLYLVKWAGFISIKLRSDEEWEPLVHWLNMEFPDSNLFMEGIL